MITLYEQLKKSKRGDVFYTERRASNVTSAASRVGRKVSTEACLVYPVVYTGTAGSTAKRIVRVKVLS